MNRRLQLLILFSLPFLLTGFLVLVQLQERLRREAFQAEQAESRWIAQARQALASMQAGHTIGAQIDQMGIRLKERLRRSWGRSGPTDLPRAARGLNDACVQIFPSRHRPPGTVIYGFQIRENGSGPSSVMAGGGSGHPTRQATAGRKTVELFCAAGPGKGLALGQERLLPSVIEGFLGLARGTHPDGLSVAAMNSRCRGLFGTRVTPALLGRERRGRLVPVDLRSGPGYLLWDFFEIQGRPAGGYVLFFPGDLKRRVKPLSYCLDQVFRENGGRMLPLLVPVNPFLPGKKSLVHPACRELPGLRRMLSRFASTLDREAFFPVHRLKAGEGMWMMRGFFSQDRSMEGWVVSRAPTGRESASRLADRTIWQMFLGAWLGVLLPFLITGKFPEVSIRWTFPFFFILMAAVPLSMMYSFGSFQIESWHARSIQEKAQAALEEIAALDGEVSEVITEFTQISRQLLDRPGWLARLAAPSAVVEEGAASEAFRWFASSSIPLDLLLLYKQGKYGRMFARNPVLKGQDQRALDFFAPVARNLIHRCELDRPIAEIFPLTESQKRFHLGVGREIVPVSGGLKGSSEIGQTSRISESWEYLSLPQTFSDQGRVKAFFLLLSDTEEVYPRYLQRRVAQRALESPEERFFLGRFHPGREKILLPPMGSSLWATSKGRAVYRFLVKAAEFQTPLLMIDQDRILAARRCPKLGDFVIGREILLAGFHSQAWWQRFLLLALILFLAGVALAIGYGAVTTLIEPLTMVEKGLQKLSHGQFPPPLELKRADELGEMTGSFDRMVSGLKQRLKLGRFVSGSLEEAVDGGAESGRESGTVTRAVVLASDLRNFTTISETHSPEIVVEMLNQHLEAMSDQIRRRGGRIDKFIGDAIIAVFTGENPCARAVSAAIGMREQHDSLQIARRETGLFPYEMGVGIDVGEVFVGSIGSLERSEFTVFGPPREAAETLEAASKKGLATRIMVSQRVREEAGSICSWARREGGCFEVTGFLPADGRGGPVPPPEKS